MKFLKLVALLLVISTANAQSSQDISLEDIWKNYKFYARSINGIRSMSNGLNFTTQERGKEGINLVKNSYKETGAKITLIDATDLIFDGNKIALEEYEFSSDEKKILIGTEVESIYRYSSKSLNYI